MIDEKILVERLEKEADSANDRIAEQETEKDMAYYDGFEDGCDKAIEIVNQLAEENPLAPCYLGSPCEYQNEDAKMPMEYWNNGWIPCSERLPESGLSVIVSYKDRFLTQADGTCEGWYDATNMIWHLTDYEYSDNAEVIAWRERLAPYKPKE